MRKLLIAFTLLVVTSAVNAQAYKSINVIPSTYVTVSSHDGITVQGTTVNPDKSLTVTFKNNNSNNYDSSGEIKTYSFEWYLSYKGKRVSDYFTDAIRCGKTDSHTVHLWPGEVPTGYEKYVTVQLGRERKPIQKDRRDND
ncbi:MAG: hypothetical protein IJU81_00265 [Bacteroidales bacterium]|nr:hypothetical protein [Bacteroidales bacterium]